MCQQIFKDSDSEMLDISQYCKISNGNDSLYTLVIEQNPFMVKFVEQTVRCDVYRLSDLKVELLTEDCV